MSEEYDRWAAEKNAQAVIDDNDWEAQEGEEMLNKLNKGYQRQQQRYWQDRDQQISFEEFERFKQEKQLSPEQVQAMQQKLMQDAALTEKVIRKKHRKGFETVYKGIMKDQPAAQRGQRPQQTQQQPGVRADALEAAREKVKTQKGGLRKDEREALIRQTLDDLLR